jgi:hypothetical protein
MTNTDSDRAVSERLESCPFCGWAPDTSNAPATGTDIYCPNESCGGARIHVSIDETERHGEEAVARWNRRSARTAVLEEAATHRHKKHGTEYVLIGFGRMQAENWYQGEWSKYLEKWEFVEAVDMREVAIYRSVDDGSLWVRPREEFEDGRFEVLATQDPRPEQGRRVMGIAWIRKSYGVPAYRGGRVEYTGGKGSVFGTIAGANGQYLSVRFDGRKRPAILHPTWNVRYLDKDSRHER